MKVKIKLRPLVNLGSKECQCCADLSWKALKLDRQALKEAINDSNYVLDLREGKVA